MKQRRFIIHCVAIGLIAILLLGVVACSSPTSKAAATLSSIAVAAASPDNSANLAVGATQQFTATGTYSDGTTPDISSQVTWASSDPSIATID